jgi:hypothetical protein
MIDPFKISLDIRDRGWVSEVEPHPHKFNEFNGSFFIWTIPSRSPTSELAAKVREVRLLLNEFFEAIFFADNDKKN